MNDEEQIASIISSVGRWRGRAIAELGIQLFDLLDSYPTCQKRMGKRIVEAALTKGMTKAFNTANPRAKQRSLQYRRKRKEDEAELQRRIRSFEEEEERVRQAEEDARVLRAAEEARRQAEEACREAEVRRQAEEEGRRQAEEEGRRQAEEEGRRQTGEADETPPDNEETYSQRGAVNWEFHNYFPKMSPAKSSTCGSDRGYCNELKILIRDAVADALKQGMKLPTPTLSKSPKPDIAELVKTQDLSSIIYHIVITATSTKSSIKELAASLHELYLVVHQLAVIVQNGTHKIYPDDDPRKTPAQRCILYLRETRNFHCGTYRAFREHCRKGRFIDAFFLTGGEIAYALPPEIWMLDRERLEAAYGAFRAALNEQSTNDPIMVFEFDNAFLDDTAVSSALLT